MSGGPRFATDTQRSPFLSSSLRLSVWEIGSSLIALAGYDLVTFQPLPPVLGSQECTTRTGVSRLLTGRLLGSTIPPVL